ncbi:hypothetical protein HNR24_001023 [Nesterenkonia jeotgali]|uniref:Uncharacterized protein n=1 Tax=Nesterenkonia jeotgali TaxID=317018 RepID=A0A839FHA6_9MICC|nr:hypothetical protein [Nesterenkonia jeotgali]
MTVSRQDAAGNSAVLGRVMRPLNSLVEKLIP